MSSCSALPGIIARSKHRSISAQIGDKSLQIGKRTNTNVKDNNGAFASRDINNINYAKSVHLIHIPLYIIILISIGWPLALIGWSLPPLLTIIRRHRRRKRLAIKRKQ